MKNVTHWSSDAHVSTRSGLTQFRTLFMFLHRIRFLWRPPPLLWLLCQNKNFSNEKKRIFFILERLSNQKWKNFFKKTKHISVIQGIHMTSIIKIPTKSLRIIFIITTNCKDEFCFILCHVRLCVGKYENHAMYIFFFIGKYVYLRIL